MERNAHPTKSGPGRKHGHKVKHGKQPTPPVGAWAGLHTNPARNTVRAARRLAKQANSGQHPKPLKERQHKTSPHRTRDQHGAYTWIGRDIFGNRRKWLGGVSAQRGF